MMIMRRACQTPSAAAENGLSELPQDYCASHHKSLLDQAFQAQAGKSGFLAIA
jgi:hypothetical protein